MIGLASAALAGVSVADGVVVDVAAGVVFVAAPGGGIDALALADGALRWHSAVADVPLAVEGEVLAAWADAPEAELRVVALDPRSGRRAWACPEVRLPAGIPGGVDDRIGDRRSVGARVEDGSIVAWWSASTWYAGGPAASEEHRRASARSFAGAGACGANGRWSPAEAPPAPSLSPPPVPDALAGRVEGGLPLGGWWVSWACVTIGTQLPGGPSQTVARLLQASDPASGELVRQEQAGRCDGTPHPPLLPAVDGEAFAVPTPTGTALYRSRDLWPIARLTDVPMASWVWTGEVVVAVGGGEVTVVGRHLAPRWSHAVRDRSYRGPIPQ